MTARRDYNEEMRPVQDVASSVLAEIVRRQPASRERTEFAWSIAVGPALARATTIELREGILYVTPKDSRWPREIERARQTIVERLNGLLGDEVSELRVLPAPQATIHDPRTSNHDPR